MEDTHELQKLIACDLNYGGSFTGTSLSLWNVDSCRWWIFVTQILCNFYDWHNIVAVFGYVCTCFTIAFTHTCCHRAARRVTNNTGITLSAPTLHKMKKVFPCLCLFKERRFITCIASLRNKLRHTTYRDVTLPCVLFNCSAVPLFVSAKLWSKDFSRERLEDFTSTRSDKIFSDDQP